jgi:hypothetical protein
MMIIEIILMNRSCDETPTLVVRTTLILLADERSPHIRLQT